MNNINTAITMVLGICMISCVDPAFQQYIQERQAAIATMPDGAQKFYEQARLDEQILADKRQQEERVAAAMIVAGQGMQNAAVNYQNAMNQAATNNAIIMQSFMSRPQSTLGTALNPVQVQVQRPIPNPLLGY
jgi:hypothetical protein